MDSPAPNKEDPNATLSPEDIKKLTDQLSSEIDQEIKKQFASDNGLDTQQKVNAVLREQVSPTPQPQKPPDPVVPTNPVPPQAKVQPNLAPPSRENPAEGNFDPLSASVSSALSDLKEGDKIDGWTLKKIYSTSFGPNKSSFYELVNEAGAKWTLNPEEMKELLKKGLTSSPKEPVNLAPTPEPEKPALETQTLAETPGGKPIRKMIEDAIGKIKKEDKQVSETPPPSTPESPKTQDSTSTANSEVLTKEQIDLLTKLHADKKLWSGFTSLTKDQFTKINELYEKGQLAEIGIDAHPLTDKLESENFGKEILVKKGDTITTLLTTANFTLTFQPTDSLVLGVHLLGNLETVKETLEKVASSGISTPEPLSQQEIIDLIKKGLGGDNSSYQKLITILTFLPLDSKLRIFSPEEIESLRKYF
ncbi:MAG TPA: hypothetical protein VLE47_00640 [Candidatus Saccharimonadales bacterium]|nr:hypothetical protein [Candidatus Saccharimonadales bacterium]